MRISDWSSDVCSSDLVTRHPLVANLLLPPFIFILLYRVPFDMPRSWRRERSLVHLTNLTLVAVLGGLGLALGYDRVAAVQGSVLAVASRSEEHTSELQSLMRISYAVFCLKTKTWTNLCKDGKDNGI